MAQFLSVIMAIMTFFGNWFGLADSFCINPARLTFESENLVTTADVSVSENTALKALLLDCSTLTSWSTGKENGAFMEIDFGKQTSLNTVVLRESTDNVKLFKIYIMGKDGYECIYEQDRIMSYRLCDLDDVTTSKLKIEFTEITDEVKLSGLEIYNENRQKGNFRVCDYMTLNQYGGELVDADYFPEYFDVVTDLTLFSAVSLDENANLVFTMGEDVFASQVEKIKAAIGDRDVKLFCTVLFQLYSGEEGYDDNDYRRDFINGNLDKIAESLRYLTETYGLDGIDFDWEHPTEKDQFKSYDKLILKTAEFTKVSVACVTWSFGFSQKAIAAVDHFNVMSYDLFDQRGNHSNIYDCGRSAIEKMIAFTVPKDKIFLGLPSYCRPVDKSGYWGSFKDYPDMGKFNNKVENASYFADGKENTNTVYFNSCTDFRDKTALSLQYGCGGIMIFNMHSDLPYSYDNSLHKAVKDAIN